MFRKIIDRITRVNVLKEEIAYLRQQVFEQNDLIERLISENTKITPICNRLSVVENDRDELFRRTDSLEAGAAKISGRAETLENDRDELFRRTDSLEAGAAKISGRAETLENDRDELFRRTDSLEAGVADISGKAETLESDRDELFLRSDKAEIGISVLENDRTELFSRIDEIRSIIDRNRLESKEDVWAAEIAVRDSLDNIHRMINPDKELPVVHFIRTLDIENVGDKNCGPYEYFKNEFSRYNCVFHTLKEVRFDLIHKDDFVILGGDGMLECSKLFSDTINKLLFICKHVIGWGIGHNKHSMGTVLYEADIPDVELSRFELLGIRDFNYSETERYCPCVSCMMNGLEEKHTLKRRIGVISHHHFIIHEFRNYDHLTNSDSLDEILRFIGESEVIITNTYHCAYWSVLMGKKVILYKPFSEKFKYYKYPPVVYSGDLEADISAADNYMNALEDCRIINREFMSEVIKIIEQGRK